ncbi:MAG: RHS repeat-associated core domain-containing protein [Pseudomonadota bacterium]
MLAQKNRNLIEHHTHAHDVRANIAWREDYTPFGEARLDPAGNDDNPNFTGHIRDHDTGLVYAQARYYDPVIGRFLSTDPVGFAEGGPGYFNRYAYTANDPVNNIDPDGRFCVPCVTGAIGGGIGAITGGVSAALTGGNIFKGAAKGAITGAVIGATGNIAAGTATAGAVGAVDGALTAASKEDATAGSIAAGATGQAAVDAASVLVGGTGGKAVSKAVGGTAGEAADAATSVIGAVLVETGVDNLTSAAENVGNAIAGAGPAIAETVGTLQNIANQRIPDIDDLE